MKQAIVLIAFFFISFSCSTAIAEFFKYVDEKGKIRYTDNLEDVPPGQRSNVEIYDGSVEKETKASENKPADGGENPDVSSFDEATIERLNRTKAEMDKEYQLLQKEIDALNKEREQLVNRAYDRMIYEKKVEKLNERIENYEKRRRALEAEFGRGAAEREE